MSSNRSNAATALHDYVRTLVTHFKGRLDSLNVVNEPFDVSQGTASSRVSGIASSGPATRRPPGLSMTAIRTSNRS
ncbi:endo-1,4-beta-xylanase [Arthrobacter sp. FW306-04-A]|uniref:endo-1,4-beta-xylanase n=1 Tax=Arthrobacter sp. FW306-04-A TaxID=2879619 RepID=UPI0037BE5C04|nr:endo-1,4-beta-xylanase [Arthrobacter sp. FW306-04-A]